MALVRANNDGHISGGRLAVIFSLALVSMELGTLRPSLSWGADFVIHISVDGLRPDYMQAVINANNAPNFKRFQNEGAWTNNARTDYTHTNTLPNHTSMITGRPVSQPAGLANTTYHGYSWNTDPALPTDTIHNFAGPGTPPGNPNVPYKASTFDVAHDAGLSTALFASKSKFVIYDQSFNATNGAAHANGKDKIDRFYSPESTPSMQSQLLTDLAANHYKYTFIHYADCDAAGHRYGWDTSQWNTALTTIDGYLGQLLALVEDDATLAGRTAIILSADHGGTGFGHSSATAATNYTIPFFVWGAGVASGDLYAFNSDGDTRVNPGILRPDYVVSGQPIRNGDGGNLALDLLGLGPIPGSLINAAQTLRVAVPGDYNYDNVVDAADYVVWRKTMGTQPEYDVWRAHFGETVPGSGSGSAGASPSQSAVPEPKPLVLLLAALAIGSLLGRRSIICPGNG